MRKRYTLGLGYWNVPVLANRPTGTCLVFQFNRKASVTKNLKSPKPRQILSAAAVNNLKVARFFIKLKCTQLSHFGRFYVAN